MNMQTLISVKSRSAFAAALVMLILKILYYIGCWGTGHLVQRDQQRHDHHGGGQRQPQLWGQVRTHHPHTAVCSLHFMMVISLQCLFTLEDTQSRPSRGRGRTSSPSSSATRGGRVDQWKVRRGGGRIRRLVECFCLMVTHSCKVPCLESAVWCSVSI